VWAKAEHVSHDAKRIYGANIKKTWLHGQVVSIKQKKKDPLSKRAVTYINAIYSVGRSAKTKEIPLQSLKATNPEAAVSLSRLSCSVVEPPLPTPTPVANVNHDPAASPTSTITMVSTATAAAAAAAAAEAAVPVAPNLRIEPIDDEEANSTNNNNNSMNNSTNNSTANTTTPVAVAHDREWFDGPVDTPVNGPLDTAAFWEFTDQRTGDKYKPMCDEHNRELKPLDFFMACFPKKQLENMVRDTSDVLEIKGKNRLTVGELLKFFGVMILATRYEFGDRKSLWATKSSCKYVPAPAFGKMTGMARDRFDDIWNNIVWSTQAKERADDESHEGHRWKLVEDHVKNINEHRKKYFKPSNIICADESISRWYGLGGHWINVGLPMYVAMDRKPENGCEIQNCCDGISGIMMRLIIVKSEKERKILQTARYVAVANVVVTTNVNHAID